MKRVLTMSMWLVALTSSFVIVAAQSPQLPPGGPGAAGAAQPAKGTGLILGKVVDAGTGKPIAEAVVTLNIRAAGVRGGGAGAGLAGLGSSGASISSDQLAALQQLTGRGAAPNAPPKLMTDGSGMFVFHDLPKGTIQIGATAAGYVSSNAGQGRPGGPSRPIDLDDGERRNDIVIRLWKFGVVGGTVVDEAGDPAIGVTVQVLARSMVGSTPHFAQSASATTDDRGIYRVSKLTPGDYIVTVPQTQVTMPAALVDNMMQAATSGAGVGGLVMDAVMSGGPAPTAGGIRVGDLLLQQGNPGQGSITPPGAVDGHLFAYQTVFYPTATSPNQGTVVTLESGQDRTSVDFQLRPVPTSRISGVVTADGAPVTNVGVRLVAAGSGDLSADAGFEAAKTLTIGDGSFTFLAVAAGQYTLQVTKAPRPQIPAELLSNPFMQMALGSGLSAKPTGQAAQTLAATVPVSVGAEDLRDVAVVLHEGVTVSGRLVFDGSAPQPTAQQLQSVRVQLTAADGQMSALAGMMMLGQQGQGPQIDPELKFKTPRYPAGRYQASLAGAPPPAWRLKSVTIAGRELTEALELKDSDVDDVVITFTDKIGQLTGSVRGDDGKASQTATVVIFPVDNKRWNDDAANPRKPRTVTASKTGAFTANGLLGGEWLVAAMSDADVRDIKDSAFLDALSHVASRVTLGDGEKKTIDLQTVRIK